jgi:hypothetical protein
VGVLDHHPPAVAGRLTGDHHTGQALPARHGQPPPQRLVELPWAAPPGPAGQDAGVVVTDHHDLLVVGQVDR